MIIIIIENNVLITDLMDDYNVDFTIFFYIVNVVLIYHVVIDYINTDENYLNFYVIYNVINMMKNLLKIHINDFVLVIYDLNLVINSLISHLLITIKAKITVIKDIHLDEYHTVFFDIERYEIIVVDTNVDLNCDTIAVVDIMNPDLDLKILDVNWVNVILNVIYVDFHVLVQVDYLVIIIILNIIPNVVIMDDITSNT